MGERVVIGEFDIYGVYFPIFVVVAAVALLLQLLLNRVLDACGFYRLVWHRALVDLAIYVILLGVVTAAVAKGQRLFRIDQRRFQYALDQAKAEVASRLATLAQDKRDLARSKSLTNVAVTVQQVERNQQAVDVAQAQLDAANAALEVAQLNLERSTVLAPVNGIVTNFGLLPGRYVNAGASVFALIDSDTFRVEGYFEETKLRRIHIGEEASVKLIGDSRVLTGHVESIASGIEDQNRSTSTDLLALVNPTFSWVRLAQRVPVRIKLDDMPADLAFVSGRTATVAIGKIGWWQNPAWITVAKWLAGLSAREGSSVDSNN